MNTQASVIINTMTVRIAPHLAGAAQRVLDAIDYEPLKQYFESKPHALLDALAFQAKVETVALVTKQPILSEMARLFKVRLDTIFAVFIAEVITPKGDAHVIKFLDLMRVDDTFTIFNMAIMHESKVVARLIQNK
jgi:hypothetical protein